MAINVSSLSYLINVSDTNGKYYPLNPEYVVSAPSAITTAYVGLIFYDTTDLKVKVVTAITKFNKVKSYITLADTTQGSGGTTINIDGSSIKSTLPQPTLSVTWFVDGVQDSSHELSITVPYGATLKCNVKGKWVADDTKLTPTSCQGICGNVLPASDTYTTETEITFDDDMSSASWTLYSDEVTIPVVEDGVLTTKKMKVSTSVSLSINRTINVYYGYTANTLLSSDDIKAMTTKEVKCDETNKSRTITYNALDTLYCVYAYPASWGSVSKILGIIGDNMTIWSHGSVDVWNDSLLNSILYNYYISDNKGAYKNCDITFK